MVLFFLLLSLSFHVSRYGMCEVENALSNFTRWQELNITREIRDFRKADSSLLVVDRCRILTLKWPR